MRELSYSLLDNHLATFLSKRAQLQPDKQRLFAEIVARLSASLRLGHTCLRLEPVEEEFLNNVPLVSENATSPLVIAYGKLYFHRYYSYEKKLSSRLSELARVQYEIDVQDKKNHIGGLCSLLGSQLQAAELALENGLAIISGGPGTGKTTTVVEILMLLVQIFGAQLKIALAAPTGKAAMRMAESVATSLARSGLGAGIIDSIPTTAYTLHRLLGYRHGSPRFYHNNSNPMTWDIVVVDEASMVDLAMMSKLVESLKPQARLVLLGDKDQLASVESGSVLADLMMSFPGNSIELQKTYRFDRNMKTMARMINQGKGNKVWEMILDPAIENITLAGDDIIENVGAKYADYMKVAVDWKNEGIDRVFRKFTEFQVLVAVHYGALGVMGINGGVELYLRRLGYECFHDQWYLGKPLLITQNDYNIDLYNGDVGICLPELENHAPMVYFQDSKGGFRKFNIHRLPPHETVYAMTIHKSQGSEFDHVQIILPPEDNSVLSRELLYTAVTRARKSVSIYGRKKLLAKITEKTIQRNSGLQAMLKFCNESSNKNTSSF